jgi:hypothetical protein
MSRKPDVINKAQQALILKYIAEKDEAPYRIYQWEQKKTPEDKLAFLEGVLLRYKLYANKDYKEAGKIKDKPEPPPPKPAGGAGRAEPDPYDAGLGYKGNIHTSPWAIIGDPASIEKRYKREGEAIAQYRLAQELRIADALEKILDPK